MTLPDPGSQPSHYRKNFVPYLPLLGYVALTLAVVAMAYYSFQRIEGMIVAEKLHNLGAISDTKVAQVGAWREAQKRTAEGFSNGSLLADEFGRWQKDGMVSSEHKHRILQLLSELQYVNGYKTLALLDRRGVTRISAENSYYVPDAEEVQLAAQAMGSRKAAFSDFHRNVDGSQGVYIDLIVPLVTSDKKTSRVVGAAVLVIDPHTFLYPMIQSWPTRQGSAETLLVRREGDDVIFLNDLRYSKGAALSLRIPLAREKLPSAMALRSGVTGTVDGIDYRGIAVVAAMREVPGTPWFMVAKVDKAELFAPINRLKIWMAGLGMVVAMLGGGLFLAWFRGIRARYALAMAQRDAALEREMLVKHFEYLNRYASDIILVADETGKITEVNERAVEVYGYTREELLRMKISGLRLPTENPAIFEAQLARLMKRGELRYETVNRRKDGTVFPVEVSIRVIEVQGAKYLHGAARDITARKDAENALRKSETILRESQRIAQIGSWELDLVNNTLSWSNENYRIFEIDRTSSGVSYEAFLNVVHPDDRYMVDLAYTDSVKGRIPYDIVHRLLFPDQRVKYVREWCETFYDQEGRPIRSIGTTQDITAHKLDEEALRASENRYRILVESSPFCIHEIDLEGRLQSINRAGLDMLGLDDARKICGMPYLDAVSRQDAGRVGALLQDAIANGTTSHFEFAAAGDVPLYFKSCFIPIQDAGGKVLKLMGITEDITERRQAEDALRKSETMLRESQRIAQTGSWELDLVNNALFWSDENYRIFEIDRTRFGASYEAFLNTVHPDDRPMVNLAYTDSVKNRTPYDIVHRLLFPEQRVKYVREWCETFYDREGRPIRSIGTTQDITAHKLAERRIHRLNSLYAAISLANEAIIRIGDRSMLLHEICRIAVEYGRFRLAWIGLIDGATRMVKSVAAGGEARRYLDNLDISIDADSPIGLAIRDGREYICNDFLDSPHLLHMREDAEKYGFHALAACPLEFEGQVVGVLAVYAGETDYFDDELANLLSDLSGDISLALDNFAREERRRHAEEALRRQEHFIRRVLDTNPNLIYVRDAAGKYLLANHAMAALHGREPQEIVGQGAAALSADGEQLDDILRMDGEVIEKRSQVESVEHDFLGGMDRWFRVTRVPMEQPDGSVHVLCIAVDITENRLAAEKLLKSAKEIEDLYDNAPCGYHSLDQDGVYIRVNNTELEWMGYARNELVGQRNFLDMLAPASGEDFFRCLQGIKRQGGIWEQELEVLRRDGTVMPVLLNTAAIYDADGNFLMTRSSMFDITTRRLAETALRESENLFRTTVDNAPIIIWVADENKEHAYSGCNFFNRKWHDFTGHDREETRVCGWVAYVHPDDAGRCIDTYRQAFGQIQQFELEYRLLRRDGAYRWMLDSGVPHFTEEGDFSGYIGTCVDVTEHRQFEKIRAEMEHAGRLNIAGEMASGLAHELSQPLTACNNYLEGCLRRMGESEWDREKLHKAVRLAHVQAERAGKIINHLKQMMRKQGHERTLLDLNLLARDVMTFLEEEIKRLDISAHMALSPLPLVSACKVEIEQVLLNLYKNAIESMQSCPLRELRVITCIAGSGEIMVTVGDSGKGISPDTMKGLFNPFQTSKREGLGLGLAICRSFVENHGGRIWAGAQCESGAEFHFTLPVEAGHD